MKYIGSTDLPAEKDLFSIEHYRDSMAKFIQCCNTPMTISIQGTWGTGKTSFMKMVSARLQNCKFIEFNTWQFSQFDMDNDLSINLISSLIDDMNLGDEKADEAKKTIVGLKNAGRLLGGVAAVAVEKAFHLGNLGGEAKEIVMKIADALSDNGDTNPVNTIKEIKKKFETCVEDCKKNNRVDRVVIFIDDLDRLEPRKAVELLEVLKNFLDCKDCVFVLAIDYDVVQKGVSAKYGQPGGSSTIDQKKGKDFFDKIIQVPFKMPVAQYNIDEYLKNCLWSITNDDKEVFSKTENLDQYIDLVKSSIGTNPRAIKRLVNSYQLLVMVVQLHEMDIQKCKLAMFATLCLQELDLNVYNEIVRDRENLTAEKLNAFKDGSAEEILKYYPELNVDEEDEDCIDIGKISVFMGELIEVISSNTNGKISDAEMKSFREILNFSSVTSTDNSSGKITRQKAKTSHDLSDAKLRKNTLDSLKHVIDTIESCLGVEDGDIEHIVRNRTNECVTEVKIQGTSGDILVFEVNGGFAIEIYASEKFYGDFIDDEIQNIIKVKNAGKKVNNTTTNGIQYFRFPAIIGNTEQESDYKKVLNALRKYYKQTH
nr:AAA family ATPase [Clostridia bacterium]